jgi:hypothetical protein
MGKRVEGLCGSNTMTLGIEGNNANALWRHAPGQRDRISAKRFRLMENGQEFAIDPSHRRQSH